MREQDGPGVFYDGLSTLLVRQVLFGMMKFLVFDYFADFIFDLQPALAERVETQLLVSLLSGAVAGVASSIVSQPADTVLTRMNQQEGRAFFFDTAQEIWEEQGAMAICIRQSVCFCFFLTLFTNAFPIISHLDFLATMPVQGASLGSSLVVPCSVRHVWLFCRTRF